MENRYADNDVEVMRSILQRIATGPELSKDITREEARAGMQLILEERVDPVPAGIFLIALRMKRETDEELYGILDALRMATRTTVAPIDELVDLGDPYDGYARSLPVAPFLPAVLAACGVPTVSHGVESMGPKYGVTHRQVLRAAGVPTEISLDAAVQRLTDPAIGWTYIDQSIFCPQLHALTPLRSLIVKRPALTTLEVLIGPIRARRKTHLVTGYVHKAYPRIYALMAKASGFDSALLVRGIEGSAIPSLRQEGKYFRYDGNEEPQEFRITPREFGIGESLMPPALPDGLSTEDTAALDVKGIAQATAETGRRALEGEQSAMRENLIAAGALTLHHLRRHSSLLAAADAVRGVLDNGAAHSRFYATQSGR